MRRGREWVFGYRRPDDLVAGHGDLERQPRHVVPVLFHRVRVAEGAACVTSMPM